MTLPYYNYGPEVGATYVLTGPDGSRACFNDPEDVDFCGAVTDVTGLDSAEVRDTGDVLTDTDGGFAGTNFYGRRPITLTGTMYGYDVVGTRNTMLAKVRTATNAMNADGKMVFTGRTANAMSLYVPFRRQLPLRFSGAWIKTFNISIVSNIAPLLAAQQLSTTISNSVTATNQGDYANYPPERINLSSTTVGTLTIRNEATGGVVLLNNLLGFFPGEDIRLFPLTHQLYNQTRGIWINGCIDYPNSTWFGLIAGDNRFTTTQGQIQLFYRGAWV